MKRIGFVTLLLTHVLLFLPLAGRAQAQENIDFTEEKLPNGLDVIYAPMRQTPVVHVQVVYFVGSRDERPDRQGFAHMFEHMMFRGSAHVAPQQHMKLVDGVGGYSNANTRWDQTTYLDTLPSNQLELGLYLEADRMASFKVSEDIYRVERNVVAKEWGMNHNQPYFDAMDRALGVLYTKHPYRWTPLGNMEQLEAAPVSELQQFFNTYYVPNNATLVIAGDLDLARAKELVRKYFGWIPAGAPIVREIPQEPEQTSARRADIKLSVPLAGVAVVWHCPPYASPDNDGLGLLASILGGGRSGRVHEALVNGPHSLCAQALAMQLKLADGGLFGAGGLVLPGKGASAVEKVLQDMVADVLQNGVTPEEMNRARMEARIGLIESRKTAASVAELLSEERVLGGDAGRINTQLQRLDALTPDSLRDIARKYLRPEQATVVKVTPNILGMLAGIGRKTSSSTVTEIERAGVAPSTQPVGPRPVTFPPGYPQLPPVSQSAANPKFVTGKEAVIDGVRLIVMSDSRLPLVNWTFSMRGGSDSDPPGKAGVGMLTAQLVRRGAAGLGYKELNADLESRGISIDVSSGEDRTSLTGSCLNYELHQAFLRTRKILQKPTMASDELDRIKAATIASLETSLAQPTAAADFDLRPLLFGNSPLSRSATPQSVRSISLEDVKRHYASVYRRDGAVLVISGDISFEQGQFLAITLLTGWDAATPAAPDPDYTLPPPPATRRIVLVDNPEGSQSVIQLGVPAYDLHSHDCYAGAAAASILSSGIESRLGRYVRAEKGFAYYVTGAFSPKRHGGAFIGRTETGFDTTGAAIEAIFKVISDMRSEDVTADELAEARARTAGALLMGMQSIDEQGSYRLEAILDGYPDDYYDRYPERIGQVTAAQVRSVLDRYVHDDRMQIVVVAPKGKVLTQLQTLGEVEVRPMPTDRGGAETRPSDELLKEDGKP
jgi:zinc protease